MKSLSSAHSDKLLCEHAVHFSSVALGIGGIEPEGLHLRRAARFQVGTLKMSIVFSIDNMTCSSTTHQV